MSHINFSTITKDLKLIIGKYISFTKLAEFKDENITLIEHLYDQFKPRIKKSKKYKLFRSACLNENLLIAQWLVNTFKLNMEDLRKTGSRIITELYCENKLRAIKWLFKTFELNVKGIPEEKEDLLYTYSIKGDVKMLKWLAKTSNLTKKDFMYNSCQITIVCERDHLKTAKWLVNYFNIQKKDIEHMSYFKDTVRINIPSKTANYFNEKFALHY